MLVYYVDNSIHQIPSMIHIAVETGGKVLTDGIDSYNEIRAKHTDVDAEYYEDLREAVDRTAGLNPQAIVHCDYCYHAFASKVKAPFIQVFHGTSDKRYNYSKQLKPYDFMLLAGNKMKDDMMAARRLTPSNHRVVGYPKLDAVFRGELDKETQVRALGLSGTRPVVLYAPTWRDGHGHSSIGHFSRSLLEKVPSDIDLVIKLHPNTVRDKKYYGLFQKFAEQENIKLIPYSSNVIPVMAASDILVTDISTVSHEYLAFRRPMVFLASPWRFLGFRNNTWIWQCGDVVNRPRNAWTVILDRLEHPGKYADRIEECLNHVFHKPDGKAAVRAKAAISDFVKSHTPSY